MGVWNWEYTEIVKLLKAYDCYLDRDSGGSHEVRYSPHSDKDFTVVRPHGGDRVSADGTFLGMIEKAGISKDQAKEFRNNRFKK